MMGAMNNDDVHMATMKTIINSCPNLKDFYEAAVLIRKNHVARQWIWGCKHFHRLQETKGMDARNLIRFQWPLTKLQFS